MALVGYARVSSVGQSLEVQLGRLAHCERVFQEKRSGTSDQRPELRACLDWMREGDTLVVTKLDRLARSTLHLCALAEELAHKQIQLDVLDQAIETRSPTGRLLFHVLGALAEFETALRHERQMEGIAHAKAHGVQFGHKPALTPAQVQELRQSRADGVLIRTLMAQYELSKASVYRYLAQGRQGDTQAAAAD
jgi:DNA invertase Pin-like site-specific DNA recombinase